VIKKLNNIQKNKQKSINNLKTTIKTPYIILIFLKITKLKHKKRPLFNSDLYN